MARKPVPPAAVQLPADAIFAACDNSHDLFVLVKDGKIVRANMAFRNFVGIRAKALAGRDLVDFVHEADRPSLQQWLIAGFLRKNDAVGALPDRHFADVADEYLAIAAAGS